MPRGGSLEVLDQKLRLVVLRSRHFHLDAKSQHAVVEVGAVHERPETVKGGYCTFFPDPASNQLPANRCHALSIDEYDSNAAGVFLIERGRLGRSRVDRWRVLSVRRDESEAMRVANS